MSSNNNRLRRPHRGPGGGRRAVSVHQVSFALWKLTWWKVWTAMYRAAWEAGRVTDPDKLEFEFDRDELPDPDDLPYSAADKIAEQCRATPAEVHRLLATAPGRFYARRRGQEYQITVEGWNQFTPALADAGVSEPKEILAVQVGSVYFARPGEPRGVLVDDPDAN
jgi:hypothetical protein